MITNEDAVEVFYEHYHQEGSDDTCYQAVCRAIGKVVEYVQTGERPTKERAPVQADLFLEGAQ